MGRGLKQLVKLIDDFGADVIVAGMDKMAAERDADLIVSTAAQAGREWPTVKLADDFPKAEEGGGSAAELRLPVRRRLRQLQLDVTGVPYFAEPAKAVPAPTLFAP